jgi:hypothetical protein
MRPKGHLILFLPALLYTQFLMCFLFAQRCVCNNPVPMCLLRRDRITTLMPAAAGFALNGQEVVSYYVCVFARRAIESL